MKSTSRVGFEWRRSARRGAVAVSSLLFANQASAEQFVLFDATFDYSWEDAQTSSPSQSHYYVSDENWMNLERPDDWVAPVNYRDGSVHIRVEVFEKPPGDQQVGWALCYIANVGSYGCPYSDYYTEVGVYERDVAMDSFWTSGPITWESGVKQVDLVYTVNNSGSGHVHNFPELAELTTPTSVRITMVQVSAGDSYDPSILDEPEGTGGAPSGSGGGDSGGSGESPTGGGGEPLGADAGGTGGDVDTSVGVGGMESSEPGDERLYEGSSEEGSPADSQSSSPASCTQGTGKGGARLVSILCLFLGMGWFRRTRWTVLRRAHSLSD